MIYVLGLVPIVLGIVALTLMVSGLAQRDSRKSRSLICGALLLALAAAASAIVVRAFSLKPVGTSQIFPSIAAAKHDVATTLNLSRVADKLPTALGVHPDPARLTKSPEDGDVTNAAPELYKRFARDAAAAKARREQRRIQ